MWECCTWPTTTPTATCINRAATNAQPGSKTVHVGLEWHPLTNVRESWWRSQHMHFSGQHRAAAAIAV